MGPDPEAEAVTRARLAAAPAVPARIDLFTSNTLFGQPGIYPDGPQMVPAAGIEWTEAAARSVLPLRCRARFGAAAMVAAAPDPGVRAGLALLGGTIAAPLLAAFPATTAVTRLTYGEPASPGRVVGPAAGADDTDRTHRVVNLRYRFEHPASLAPSLAHDLLWHPGITGHAAETILHAIAAMVHVQLVAADPAIGCLGTELARRQNSLAITLLNSRNPGSHRITLMAPTGYGTVPGGDPRMQTPDFWSVPFAPPGVDPAPALLGEVIDQLVSPSIARPDPLRFDDVLGAWLSAHTDERWLPVPDQARVAEALGLIPA